MTPASTAWDRSDAWFLTALAIVPQPAALDEVYAAGDAVNHALFTDPEVLQAIRRLVGSGLIEAPTADALSLTPAGAVVATRGREGLRGLVTTVHRRLARISVTESDTTITAADSAAAATRYAARADAVSRGTGR